MEGASACHVSKVSRDLKMYYWCLYCKHRQLPKSQPTVLRTASFIKRELHFYSRNLYALENFQYRKCPMYFER